MTEKAKRLVVDSSVAMYLLRANAPPGQHAHWLEAQELLRIPPDEWTLCLPTPALGEVLAGVDAKVRRQAADILAKMFEILDLDKDAAVVVGDIALAGIRGRRGTRQQVKVDVEIVACAIRWNAEGICFLDGDHDGIVARSGIGLRTGRPSDFAPPQRKLFEEE